MRSAVEYSNLLCQVLVACTGVRPWAPLLDIEAPWRKEGRPQRRPYKVQDFPLAAWINVKWTESRPRGSPYDFEFDPVLEIHASGKLKRSRTTGAEYSAGSLNCGTE